MERSLDLAIASIAERQHGNITRGQLIDIGLNADQIDYRVKTGRLHRVHRGVYAVGRPPRTAIERAAAAVLACGPDAALSHRSALALWGLTDRWPWASDVIVPRDRRPKGISVHRAADLISRDFRRHNSIRATSPARTILDCAPFMSDKALARAVNEARRSKQLRLSDLADVVRRFPYHRGACRLRPLASASGGPTRSGWEDSFPAFCRRFGLPEPVMAAKVAGYEVDALFPREKVIVELDGWEFHSTRASFESDRDRDASTLATGHVTVRVTWERMHGRPHPEAARLHKILEQRRGEAA